MGTLSVGTPIWLHWLRIAKSLTRQARAGADTAPPEGSPTEVVLESDSKVGHINDEMYPAMVAIAAVAFALDGLYDQVRDFAPIQFSGRPNRQRRILETLKVAFSVGKYWEGWLVEFDWLDGLRDPAVHPSHVARPVVSHPSGWGNVPVEYVEYSADNAEKALGLLENVLRKCVENPRPASCEWAEGTGRATLTELEA